MLGSKSIILVHSNPIDYYEVDMTETKLGHFVLLDVIGEGGMGRVYKARDTRLERLVAIKVLPESKLADADRRARFVQEAKAASALNHPNIITIHEIGEQDGQTFIVMELVDGKALDELILPKGMRMVDALRVATQVADALATAHAAGIVHRDLKPGNIMVDSQGRVKVLDFGLAKLMTPASPTADETVTVAMHKPATELGTILGSVPYMSPEQAEGKAVDARSDIFSFGAVLYEMLCGKRAFGGESRISTLAAVVEKDPKPLSEITSSTPPELERLVARCLRKDVNRRSQHMADVKLALIELREESESGKTAPHAPPAQKRRRWLWPAVAVTAVVAALGGAWAVWRQKPLAAPQQSQMTRLSPDDDASYESPGISPDGKFVVYSSDRGGNRGKDQLWLQPVGGGDPVQLTHFSDQCRFPRFTPNGLSVVYQRRGNEDSFIESIPLLGGQSRQIALIKGSRRMNAPVVAPDGSRVAFYDLASWPFRLLTVPLEGGEPRAVAAYDRLKKDAALYSPRWTSDSRHLIVLGRLKQAKDDAVVIPLGEGEVVETGAHRLLEQAGAGVSSLSAAHGDRLLFRGQKDNQAHVWELRMSPQFQPIGPPRQLTFGTGQEVVLSVSASGLAAVMSVQSKTDLYWVPADTKRGVVTGPPRRLTADGREKGILY
ncbi:MAG: serine/threonine-protein kinase, partial [Acidobacteriota bacterium]|nr:serine/threonine-protein kinase [Acidobacteriota bacterium]